jgi:diguanylate cyclase (GGDEF)-like protein
MSGATLLWITICAFVALVATFASSRVRRALSSRVEQEQRRAERTAELQIATLEALALAVDARERPPRDGKRVQYFAVELARTLGLSGDELEAIRAAALLRDIGKLAVPDHILAKPGPLTPEEIEKVKCHPRAGAEIIGVVPFPYPVAPLILSHHERWDGTGYPDGLRGADIPLGARVLAVVDSYDALVSTRPYHSAAAPEAAASVLRQEAGRRLDPVAVEAFLRILPTLRYEGVQPLDGGRTVLDDISGAHRELDVLYEISRSMGTTLGVAETMALISSKLAALVPFSACALFLTDEDTDDLTCWFATGVESDVLRGLTFPGGQGHTGWVARHRSPLIDVPAETDLAAGGSSVPTALQSALITPLLVRERLVGTLCFYHTERGVYTRDHRRVMERVCDQAAAVLHNSQLFDRTRAASLTDALTGLPNRRVLETYVATELSRTERIEGELALIVLDVDEFKSINDTHGHHAGDRALKQVANALSSRVRPYDVCARFAGDEFVIVLTECGPEQAEARRLEFQEAVANIAADERAPLARLSVSAGAACYPVDGTDYDSLLAVADRRMYSDKARGRARLSPRASLHVVGDTRAAS